MSNQHGSELTDDQLAEYEEKMAGDDYSNKAPRKAKQFWPSAKRLLGLLAPYKLALTAVFAMNAVSVVLAVYAPRVMGRAMDVIFSGVMSKHMPPGTTKEQAIEGLRAAGQDRFADMASAMELTPGSGIDFDRLGQLIVLVNIRVPGDTRAPVALIQLPLGLNLPVGAKLQVDDGKAVDVPIQTCEARGCYINAPIAADVLTQLKSGKQLKVSFQNLGKETISIPMPLADFATVYDKIK